MIDIFHRTLQRCLATTRFRINLLEFDLNEEKHMSRTNPEEDFYLLLLQESLDHGSKRIERTKVGTRALFGRTLRFDLSAGCVPILTTKKIFWKTAVRELLWMISGETNIRPLVTQGVSIWTDWPLDRYRRETGEEISRKEFEDLIIVDEQFAAKWGDLGPVYGKQWRRWSASDGSTVDQLGDVLHKLRTDPYSRRMIMSGWNAAEIGRMALPPCHTLYQWYVSEGRVSCSLYQRSCDMFLGLPFNVFEASLLTRILAQMSGLEAGELVWMGGDVHVYESHVDAVKEQISRDPMPFPTLTITRTPETLDDLRFEDIRVDGYASHGPISAPVAV
jgi:thymidylate synthase